MVLKKPYKKLIITLVVVLLCIVVIYIEYKQVNKYVPFKAKVITSTFVIPNEVHFILFEKRKLDFIQFLSIVSAIKVQKPEQVLVHCDCKELSGHYWDLIIYLSKKINVPVKVIYLAKPTHVFGQKLSSVYHSADVARIQILMNYGGIYLDTDTVVLKPLSEFLRYEVVIGWPYSDNIGNQIIIADKQARLLRLWLNGYKQYRPFMWYYNAGQYPTDEVLAKNPSLVHRVPVLFGVHNLLSKLHGVNEWHDWRRYYTIHLLSRHHPAPQNISEAVIEELDTAFGELSRWLLYHIEPALSPFGDTWL